MHVFRIDLGVFENKRPGGAGVMNDDTLESEIVGRPRSRLDAHVCHHSANDEPLDLALLQIIEQVGIDKAVGVILGDHLLPLDGLHAGMDLAPRFEVVTDMYDEKLLFPELFEKLPGVGACFFRACELRLAPREIEILDIYDKQGRRAGVRFL